MASTPDLKLNSSGPPVAGDGGLGAQTNPTIPFAVAAPLWQARCAESSALVGTPS